MKIDFRDHVLDHFFNALARLSRCLMIVHLMLHGEVLRHVRGNGDLISQVNFVASYHYGRVCVLHLVDRLDPPADLFEGLFSCFVEGDDDAVSLPIKLVRDVSEFLLPRRVPNLHIHAPVILSIVVLVLYELDSNRFQVIRLELALIDVPQQTCFAYRCVSKYDQIYLWLHYWNVVYPRVSLSIEDGSLAWCDCS